MDQLRRRCQLARRHRTDRNSFSSFTFMVFRAENVMRVFLVSAVLVRDPMTMWHVGDVSGI
jgi:hypothetical protein